MRFISNLLCLTLSLSGALYAEDAKPDAKPAAAAAGKVVINGTVAAIDFDAATITVQAADGKKTTLKLTDDTKSSIDGIEAGMAQVQIGDSVWVKGNNGVAEAIGVKRAK